MREQIADLRLFEIHVKDLFNALPDAVKPGDGMVQEAQLGSLSEGGHNSAVAL
jgi:hypothetical protein